MKVGEVYRLREEVEELTPSFYSAVMGSLGKPSVTRFSDAKYVLNITYFTDPLRLFVENVVTSLKKPGVTPFPLIRGFGFGKTHSLILLWHLFTSDADVRDDHVKACLNENRDIIKQTFVLACDVSVRESPFKSFVETLFGSKEMDKDPDLLRVLVDLEDKYNDLTNPTALSDFLIEFVNESKRRFRKTPKFLILVDELGFGTIERIDRYVDTGEEELIEDIRRLISFLASIAERLKNVGSSIVIIYAFADQDLKSLEARIMMHHSNEELRVKLEGLKGLIETDLKERLLRHAGGIETSALNLNYTQNIEIAKFRVLNPIRDENEAKNTALSYVENILETFKIFENETVLKNYLNDIKRFYPISPDLVNLLKKVHDDKEFPKTQFVRTVISLLRDATRNALLEDPNSPLIGVRFLSLQQSALLQLMDEFAQGIWFSILKDIDISLENSKNRKLAELLAKLIVSNGATSNILALIEGDERYGTTEEEIQATIVSTVDPDEVTSALEEFPDVLADLKIMSARIVEKTVDGKRYYLPSVVEHVLSHRDIYAIDERKKMEEIGIIAYLRDSVLSSLFLKLSKYSNVMIEDYKGLERFGNLSFEEPTCLIVPPWDLNLFNEIEKNGYDSTVERVVDILNQKFRNGEITRAPYLIVLIPNTLKIKDLIESLINYKATLKFIDYLKKEEELAKKYFEKVRDEILSKETKRYKIDEKRLRKLFIQNVQQQVRDARSFAMGELIRYTREVIANLLELYEKPIMYNVNEKKFYHSDRFIKKKEEKIREILSQVKSKEVDKYSDMVGGFFKSVIDLIGFEEKHTIVSQVLLNYFEKELSSAKIDKIDIDELLENLILGFYGTLPKTEEVARKAIESLNGRTIEYPDKIVRITVDKKKVRFRFERIEPKMSLSVSVTPKRLNYDPNEVVRLNIKVKNEGAKGVCFVRIEKNGSIVHELELGEINPQETKDLTIELTLPSEEGEYSYTVISSHEPTEIDDKVTLNFSVRRKEIITPPKPPRFVRKIKIEVSDRNREEILKFVQGNEQIFESCSISMYSDDFDVNINVKSVTRDNLDILLRFIQPLANRCNTKPVITLNVKHGMLKHEDVDIEGEIE